MYTCTYTRTFAHILSMCEDVFKDTLAAQHPVFLFLRVFEAKCEAALLIQMYIGPCF